MSGESEKPMETTVELLRTTIDAVGLDSKFTADSTASLLFMLGVVPILIFLALVFGAVVQCTAGDRDEARDYSMCAAVCAAVIALIYWPMVTDDSSSYNSNPLRRMISAPVHVDEDHLGSYDNTVVGAVHDQVQDELDRRDEGFKDLGLDKECRTQASLAGDSRGGLSVLCGGYSLDPVTTDKATLTPVIKTSADHVWWPWSIDPHNVEVTISIKIDKK
mgnify:CR=1 FL=1